jgi:hypothetical protein
MNKTIAVLASLAVMGSAAECMAAAVVNLNNYDSNVPIMYQATAGGAIVTAPAAGTYVQLLGAATGGTPVATTIGSTTDTSFSGIDDGGFFDKGVAVIPGVADKASVDLQLQAWTGAATYADASLKGSTAKWTQASGGWNTTSSPPGTPDSVVLNIPASGLTIAPTSAVPEPSTIALGLLGAAALLIRRRK